MFKFYVAMVVCLVQLTQVALAQEEEPYYIEHQFPMECGLIAADANGSAIKIWNPQCDNLLSSEFRTGNWTNYSREDKVHGFMKPDELTTTSISIYGCLIVSHICTLFLGVILGIRSMIHAPRSVLRG